MLAANKKEETKDKGERIKGKDMMLRMGLRSWKTFVLCAAISVCVLLPCVNVFSGVVDKVIVVVNEEVITQREFDRIFTPVKKSYEENFKGEELTGRLEEARKGLLEQMINSKLTISFAKKKKMEIDEEELKKRIEKIKSFYGSENEFLQTLSAKGTNMTEFEREMKDQMFAQKIVEEEVSARVVVAPSEIQDLYDKNKEKLVSGDRVKISGIMVRKTGDPGEKKASKKIEGIMNELKNGRNFAELARERSEGPYAEAGGDMGYISPGQLLKEIDVAVFSLKEGEFSDTVETNIGYHVFLVEEIQESRPLEFAEVSDFLKEQLYRKQFEKKLVEWLKEKRKNAYISYK